MLLNTQLREKLIKKNKKKASNGITISKFKHNTPQGKELTSKAPWGGLLGLPTLRPTTLEPYEDLERLKRPMRGQ